MDSQWGRDGHVTWLGAWHLAERNWKKEEMMTWPFKSRSWPSAFSKVKCGKAIHVAKKSAVMCTRKKFRWQMKDEWEKWMWKEGGRSLENKSPHKTLVSPHLSKHWCVPHTRIQAGSQWWAGPRSASSSGPYHPTAQGNQINKRSRLDEEAEHMLLLYPQW